MRKFGFILFLMSTGMVVAGEDTEQFFNETLMVNTTDDLDDGTCDSVHCSLREAVNAANGTAGTDTIHFDLAGSAPFIIEVNAEIGVNDTLIIDGSSQPGYTDSPLVELRAANTPLYGLNIFADEFELRAVAVTGFVNGLYLRRGTDMVVEACYIGLSADGQTMLGNEVGILDESYSAAILNNVIAGNGDGVRLFGEVTDVLGNTIGLTEWHATISNTVGLRVAGYAQIGDGTASGRNVISGNQIGILTTASCNIAGNYIGTDPTGTAAVPNETGLQISGSVRVNGNLISGNLNYGLHETGSGATLLSNFVGTDASGMSALPNGTGIYLEDGRNTAVGDSFEGDGNLISGNTGNGLHISGSGNGCIVRGNLIGTDITGNGALGNGGSGIFASSVSSVEIGGPLAGSGNLISANVLDGLRMADSSNSNLIRNNYIGTDLAGTRALGNGEFGINIVSGALNAIGEFGSPNVISGNVSGGVVVQHGNHNRILSNKIGTDVTGTQSVPNEGVGISVRSSYTIVGVPGDGNLISGNLGSGIDFRDGPYFCEVQSNLIGTDTTGTRSLGNGGAGIEAYASSTLFGGTNPGEGNVISGNALSGIIAAGESARIEGNFIGIDASDTLRIPNGLHGIDVTHGTRLSIGTEVGNIIKYNAGNGLNLTGGRSSRFRFNQIYANDGLGIDLNDDGVTPNDPLDDDWRGANEVQNFPMLDTVSLQSGSVSITGELHSKPNQRFSVYFYASPTCDESGYGEGAWYLGANNVDTDGNGIGLIDARFQTDLEAEFFVTATATNANGGTSEFSPCAGSLIFADGFESGDTAMWIGETSKRAGSLEVNEAAALSGVYGLQAATDGGGYARLLDESPNEETVYRAAFRVQWDHLTLPEQGAFDLGVGFNTAGDPWLRLEVRRENGTLLLRSYARDNQGQWYSGEDHPISDGAHFVELEWLAGSGDGYFSVLLDGRERPGVFGLSNDLGNIDSVRLGLVSDVSADTTGHIFLDDFSSVTFQLYGALDCRSVEELLDLLPNWPTQTILNLVPTASELCAQGTSRQSTIE